jgi:hypothetical protein
LLEKKTQLLSDENRPCPNKSKTTTMKAFLFASLAATAAAFAPQSAVVTSSVRVNGFANDYVGGEGPEPMFVGKDGSKNFDPAGFAEVRTYGRWMLLLLLAARFWMCIFLQEQPQCTDSFRLP